MFYIYILISTNADKYYVGYSDNPWIRVIRHNTTMVTTYTSKYRPWELAATFEVGTDEKDAIRIERIFKEAAFEKAACETHRPTIPSIP